MGCGASSSKQVEKVQSKPTNADEQISQESLIDLNGPKPIVIFVLGGPGSGKTTHCERLVKENPEYVRFTLEEVLTAERNKNTKYGKEINDLIGQSQMIPAKLSVKILKHNMKAAGWSSKKFLLEGFPKNQKNMDTWTEVLKARTEVKAVFHFECSTQVMETRVNERSATSGRAEDQPPHLKKRMDVFENDTKKIIKQFDMVNLVKKINTERPQEQIYEEFKKALTAALTAEPARISGANTPVHSKTPSIIPIINNSVVSQPQQVTENIPVVATPKLNMEKEKSPTVIPIQPESAKLNVVTTPTHTPGQKSAPPQLEQMTEEVKKEEESPKEEEKPIDSAKPIVNYMNQKKEGAGPQSVEELDVVDNL